jgi:hypothetical protein
MGKFAVKWERGPNKGRFVHMGLGADPDKIWDGFKPFCSAFSERKARAKFADLLDSGDMSLVPLPESHVEDSAVLFACRLQNNRGRWASIDEVLKVPPETFVSSEDFFETIWAIMRPEIPELKEVAPSPPTAEA